MSVSRQLYQLQEVDLELEANEQALAQVNARIGESRRVIAARRELEAEQQQLEELKKQQHAVEWEVDGYSAKIAEIDEKLYSGRVKNPKELSNLQQEVEGLKGQCRKVEDKVLEIMELVSEGEAKIAALGSELQKLETEWRQEQRQLSAEAERYQTVIADLRQKRQAQVDSADPAVIKVYQDVRGQKGWAVARIERGTCRGCGITLSTAQLQQARSNNMLRCGNCGRILFLA